MEILPVLDTDCRPAFSEETLVSKRVVAGFLGMTISGFSKMVRRGEGPPYYRFGRMIRFSPTAVKAWIDSQVEVTQPQSD
jgi:predicted DNA-binding transcriptional regulator AlpA